MRIKFVVRNDMADSGLDNGYFVFVAQVHYYRFFIPRVSCGEDFEIGLDFIPCVSFLGLLPALLLGR